jgi:hypothetical protein
MRVGAVIGVAVALVVAASCKQGLACKDYSFSDGTATFSSCSDATKRTIVCARSVTITGSDCRCLVDGVDGKSFTIDGVVPSDRESMQGYASSKCWWEIRGE